MGQVSPLDLNQIRKIFDRLLEEVHYWEVLRDENNLITTWRLVYANKSALKTWNVSSLHEISNKTTDEIFGSGATEHYMPIVEKVMNDGCPHSFEDYFPNLNKHFRFTTIPMDNFFITIGWDISDLVAKDKLIANSNERLIEQIRFNKELELRVAEQTKELEESNQTLVHSIEFLQRELADKFDDSSSRVAQLLHKHCELLEKNSRILKSLLSAQKHNRELSRKLLSEDIVGGNN